MLYRIGTSGFETWRKIYSSSQTTEVHNGGGGGSVSRLKRLIQEIHRRSHRQVLGIYLGGAWVPFQGIEVLAEASSDAISFVSREDRDDRRHSNTRYHRPPARICPESRGNRRVA
jgi:hypothetical protein